jgi:hypothetical protein
MKQEDELGADKELEGGGWYLIRCTVWSFVVRE